MQTKVKITPSDEKRVIRCVRGTMPYRPRPVPTRTNSLFYQPLPNSTVQLLQGEDVVATIEIGNTIPSVINLTASNPERFTPKVERTAVPIDAEIHVAVAQVAEAQVVKNEESNNVEETSTHDDEGSSSEPEESESEEVQ